MKEIIFQLKNDKEINIRTGEERGVEFLKNFAEDCEKRPDVWLVFHGDEKYYKKFKIKGAEMWVLPSEIVSFTVVSHPEVVEEPEVEVVKE